MSTASHSGHSHSGHSHSGHTMQSMAGMDAYAGFAATGLLADGMLHSREAVVGATGTGLPNPPANQYKTWMGSPFPALDQAGHMGWWAAHIRTHILDVELLSMLRFEKGAGGDTDSMAVYQRSVDKTVADLPIVTLKRPSIGVFKLQAEQVMRYAVLREDRMAEILTQVVPPTAYFASVLGLSEERTRFTMELMAYAQRFAMLVLMRLKHAFACPRPFEYSPRVQPLLDTPPFSAFPSGHATESYMFAGVMRRLAKQAAGSFLDVQLTALAARISINREVAGLHFPVDSMAGRMLGETLAEYFASVCLGAAAKPSAPVGWLARTFDGGVLKGGEEFDPTEAMDGAAAKGPFHKNKDDKPTDRQPQWVALKKSELANWLWGKADVELKDIGFFA